MSDITKLELKDIVFIAAHNAKELTEEVKERIETFDVDTYRRFLAVVLKRREQGDCTGEPGGGIHSASYLREAVKNLEHILSH